MPLIEGTVFVFISIVIIAVLTRWHINAPQWR